MRRSAIERTSLPAPRKSRRATAFALVALLLAGVAKPAHAFCRTTTCDLQGTYSPSVLGACVPADFVQQCEALDPPVDPIPLWWRNACVSYDVQENASKQIPYATAATIAAEAFSKWTGTICANGNDVGRVSIDVRDLGPVACDLVQFNTDQGNQHVIIFRDDGSADFDLNNTLGLTTVTFDPDTGEIYDADIEINSSMTLAVTDPVPPDGYDFQSIITHEAGHFLGLAHSVSTETTMYANYSPGTTNKRILSADDMAGICAIYPPDGTRSVATSVQASGYVDEDACNPTPQHGFQSQCAQPQNASCAAASGEPATSSLPVVFALTSALGAAGALRRRRGRENEPGRERWSG